MSKRTCRQSCADSICHTSMATNLLWTTAGGPAIHYNFDHIMVNIIIYRLLLLYIYRLLSL
jgi:hypothetical protein